MNPAFGAGTVRRGEQPPPDNALRRSVRLAAAKADAARIHPFPTTHHEQDHHMTAAAIDPTVRAEQTTELQIQNRTLEMQLLHESLARAHMQERLQEAEHQRLVNRLARAQRLRQKAERASLRARKALAVALM
ncbi:hypothetical protein ABT093_12875 [Kitasatospora sp. NPDC002551]|uniref:hypothetical protein n=1 Tax=unclassified Kitasatospora TaxID=2633591 RepID=UPI00331CBAC3